MVRCLTYRDYRHVCNVHNQVQHVCLLLLCMQRQHIKTAACMRLVADAKGAASRTCHVELVAHVGISAAWGRAAHTHFPAHLHMEVQQGSTRTSKMAQWLETLAGSRCSANNRRDHQDSLMGQEQRHSLGFGTACVPHLLTSACGAAHATCDKHWSEHWAFARVSTAISKVCWRHLPGLHSSEQTVISWAS